MLNETKSIFASKTIWGAGIALVGAGVNVMGYTVTPADQAQIVEAVAAMMTAGGSLLAVIGRVRATKAIG
ncbi:hypothetical protein [uncultured Sulfitobacter sp.]|uniref:hypothetical protein n=1 Tax=uncultured Sulfitobacter sp. TaxID=191468 RepID=UPI0026249555|nr:hypothetical protein [uncultured Sulfitobacter sp.]